MKAVVVTDGVALDLGSQRHAATVKLGRHVRFIRAHVEAAILDAEMRPRVDRNVE